MNKFGPEIHLIRAPKREFTPGERIGIAQKTSLRYRDVEVKLPTPPWEEDGEE